MKNKKLWIWLAVALLVAMFVTVIVTSVILSQKRDEVDKLPDIEITSTLK